MSILARLGAERRDLGGLDWTNVDGRIPAPTEAALSSAGRVVNERTAMSVIDYYACVSLIADSISMLPARAFVRAGDIRREMDPQPPLVERPDPELDAGEFWSRVVVSLLLRGNAYAYITSIDRLGLPTSVRLLHPDDVQIRRNTRTNKIEYVLRNGQVVTSVEIIHLTWVTMPGGLDHWGGIKGLSPIECARRGLGLAIATEEYGASWFRDGASPSSVLETDDKMEDDDAKQNVARWVRSHGGRRRPALLSGGLKWRAITISPNESQFLETRGFNTSQVARLLRVPPHMIGDVSKSTSWGRGIEEQGIGFVVYTLGAHLHRMEAAWSRQLPGSQYMKFNVGALLRGNSRDRYTGYAIGRQWGWLSVNDIRRLEDLEPVDGGNTYLQPLNMIDSSEALKVLLSPKVDVPADSGGDQ